MCIMQNPIISPKEKKKKKKMCWQVGEKCDINNKAQDFALYIV